MLPNLKCELNYISDFVYRSIHLQPEQLELFLNEHPEPQTQIYLNAEIRNILGVLKNNSCKITKKSQWKKYRRTNLLEAIEILDVLENHLSNGSGSSDDPRTPLYQVIVDGLGDILIYFAKSGADDADIRIPGSQHRIGIMRLEMQLLLLNDLMEEREVDMDLQQVIKDDVRIFCEKNWCTYGELEYMEHLIADLLRMLGKDKKRRKRNVDFHDWNGKVTFTLIYMDFNSLPFIEYCWDNITADVDQRASLNAQYLRFKYHKKELEKNMTQEVLSRIKGISVGNTLLTLIEKELEYIAELRNNVTDEKHPRVDFSVKATAEEWLNKDQVIDYLCISRTKFYVQKKLGNWKEKKIEGKVVYEKSSLYLSRNSK